MSNSQSQLHHIMVKMLDFEVEPHPFTINIKFYPQNIVLQVYPFPYCAQVKLNVFFDTIQMF